MASTQGGLPAVLPTPCLDRRSSGAPLVCTDRAGANPHILFGRIELKIGRFWTCTARSKTARSSALPNPRTISNSKPLRLTRTTRTISPRYTNEQAHPRPSYRDPTGIQRSTLTSTVGSAPGHSNLREHQQTPSRAPSGQWWPLTTGGESLPCISFAGVFWPRRLLVPRSTIWLRGLALRTNPSWFCVASSSVGRSSLHLESGMGSGIEGAELWR